jgi:hypothetical protein
MKTKYIDHNFYGRNPDLIKQANSIVAEYMAEDYRLTIRQLYYQFVARNIIQNKPVEYTKLCNLVVNARLAGLIDWDAIIDKTRSTESNIHFSSLGSILSLTAQTYQLDTRATQKYYLEIWIEKEALVGVIEPTCRDLDITYLACRGYISLTTLWEASQRIQEARQRDQKAVILYLGDHDPSGRDMSRDIRQRLDMLQAPASVRRIALTRKQVDRYNLPPNPTKMSDRRAVKYIAKHGQDSWELDALNPKTIDRIIRRAVTKYTDEDRRQKLIRQQTKDKGILDKISKNWKTLLK